MERKEEVKEIFDIPVAERKYLKKSNTKFKEKIFFVISLLILLFYISAWRLSRNSKTNPFKNFNNPNNHDHSILGHLP